MKNCLCFSLKLKLFDFTSLRQGQFLANDGEKAEKKQILKSIEQGHTEGTFSLPFKIPTLCLVGASPKPQKAKAKAKMALASLVSSQKQKHTIVKTI